MLRNVLSILIVIIISLSLTGCWDSMEINEKDLTTTLIIDKVMDNYHFIVEIASLSHKSVEGDSQNENFTVVQSYGKTYVAARLNLDNKLANPIYLGTVRMLILTEDMADDGIGEYLYRLRNLHEYRKALNIVVTSEDPIEMLEIQSSSSISAGHAIEDVLSKLEKSGNAIKSSASEILEKLSSEHGCFLLPNINIDGENLAFVGYSVIQDEKLSATIPIESVKGIHYILNKDVKYIYVIPYDEYEATLEVVMSKKDIIPTYTDGEISFRLNFEFEVLVKYMSTNHGLDDAAVKQLEVGIKESLTKDICDAIYESIYVVECDYLDFDQIFRINYPTEYSELDWGEVYMDSKTSVNVEIKLDPGGPFDYNPEIKR